MAGPSNSISPALKHAAATLHVLQDDIATFVAANSPSDRYYPPVIDWHHPDDYAQVSIGGLSKFFSQVSKERAIVDKLVKSRKPPADYSTNLISLQGVWEAFKRSPRPLVGISQTIDRKGFGTIKVDVIAAGGDEWVKVNTIKQSRLLVEFREQDSYLTSDYESDLDEGPPPLTNSLLEQARALVSAAAAHSRLPGLLAPRVRYVLTRLEEHPLGGHADERIPATFAAIRALGVDLQFSPSDETCQFQSLDTEPTTVLPAGSPPPASQTPPPPSRDIILDLSVLIALCCDSTHHPLPSTPAEAESRFRPRDTDGTARPHSGASRDLRDQLLCEMEHPLIQELQERCVYVGNQSPRFWVTREVHDRFPALVTVIGGEAEQARARALFDSSAAPGSFWIGSRWEGRAGCLEDIRVGILEDGDREGTAPPRMGAESAFDCVVEHVCENMMRASNEGDEEGLGLGSMGGRASPVVGNGLCGTTTPEVEEDRLSASNRPSSATTNPPRSSSPPNSTPVLSVPSSAPSAKQRKHLKPTRKPSKNPLRTNASFPPASRLPSGHTLRTLLEGVRRHATVLSNNRGAVMKVLREAGVMEGIPSGWVGNQEGADGVDGEGVSNEADRKADTEERTDRSQEHARIWVVNPSSLAEWRRLEVEESIRRLAV